MAEEEYFWFRYDDGQWIVFDEPALAQIEDARKRGEESVRIANTPYLLNLTFLQQINENTGYPRDISKAEACWYWLDDDGKTWRRYNRDDSLKLALASLSPVGDHWTYLEHGQTLYYVDITRKVQRNTASDYERNIHQGVPPPLPPELVDDDDNNQAASNEALTAAAAGPFEGGRDATPGLEWGGSDDEEDEDEHIVEEDFETPVPRNYVCPLSKRIMSDPVQTVVGSTYERKYIERHLKRNNYDPSTDVTLKSKSLLENRVLRDSIENWRELYAAKAEARGSDGGGGGGKPAAHAPSKPAIDFTTDYVPSDTHQDTLKVVCVGLSSFGTDVALRNPTTAEGKLGVNQYTWSIRTADRGIHCNVYDFVGQKVHHATQKLFFTTRAVYVVVWDLGNPQDGSDAALERDIFEKVHFWVDAIEEHAPGAIIVPVISLDGLFQNNNTKGNPVTIKMEESEIERRWSFIREYFDKLQESNEKDLNLHFEDPVLRIGGHSGSEDRLQSLKAWILQQSSDSALFSNIGQPIPVSNQLLQDAIAHMAREGTHIVDVNQISDMLGIGNEEEIQNALQYLSDIGEILYYGAMSGDLKRFAVVNPSWLVSAVACILLPAINDAIRTVRRRQSIGAVVEKELYHGPVASEGDIRALWRAHFVSTDGTSKSGINAEEGLLLDFLHALFARIGITISLNATERELSGSDFSSMGSDSNSQLLFLPGLLSQRDQAQFVGIYNNSVFSKTTLAQSVQFRRSVSPVLMEKICASVLSRIYAETKKSGDSALEEGQLYVKEILCWRTLLHVKLGVNTRTSSGDAQWSVVDVYAHLVDSTSPLCVGATYMGEANQSLIITGKGEEGNDGQVIWRGGFSLITEAIRSVLESSPHGMDFELNYFCPSCLARQNLRDARSWSEFMLQIALGRSEEDLICEDGHPCKTQLVLRQSSTTPIDPRRYSLSAVPPDVHAGELMAGVVMVGLYDEKRKTGKIRKVGSGFVVDNERGLVVTAAHTLMLLWGQENFGRDYDGIEGAKAVIGVIPDNYDASGGYPPALFRYFATIFRKDPSLEMGECHIDACILQITSRFESDVGGNGDLCSDEISIRLTGKPALMKRQRLAQLSVTEQVHVGEPVRILGFDQPDSTRLNRTFGISAGRVYKEFETKTVGGERFRYTPRKKIVLNCPTIGGHSGGPCVNQKGEVIGILSCADFTEKSRCYLVPTSEWLDLIPEKGEVVSKSGFVVCSGPIKPDKVTLKPPPMSLTTAKNIPFAPSV